MAEEGHAILEIEPSSLSFTQHQIPQTGLNPTGPRYITGAPDGNVWFSDENNINKIDRMTPAGVVTVFSVPITQSVSPSFRALTAGPDGAIWFTDDSSNYVGRMAMDGTVTQQIAIPNPPTCPGSTCLYDGITTGPDGNIWFTEGRTAKIARLTLAAPNVAVFLLKGMTTNLSSGEDPNAGGFGDLPKALEDRGISAGSIVYYSYNGPLSSSDPSPKPYSCTDSLGSIGGSAIPRLDDQLRAYVATHPNANIYLVGHSQGGVVALGYLAYLRKSGRSVSDIPSPDGTKHGHLAGIVTLDSPLGGLNIQMAEAAWQAASVVRCGVVNLAGSADGVDFARIMATGSQLDTPWGGIHSIPIALFGASSLGDNDQMAAAAAAAGGPRVLSVGNADDTIFDPTPIGGIIDPSMTSQWLTNNTAAGIYSRQISDGGALPWLTVNLGLLGLNHGRVLNNANVDSDVYSLITGGVPSATSVYPSVVTGSSPATATGSISGTVTGTGGVELANIDVAAISTADLSAVTTTTAADGSYSIALDPGTYLIAFHDPAGAYPAGYACTSGFTTDLSGATPASVGTSITTVSVALPGGHAISGVVADSGHPALAGIRVEAQTATGTFVASAFSDVGGAYRLVLPPGSYVVKATDFSEAHAGGYYASGALSSTLTGATSLSLGLTNLSGINLLLPATVHIGGTVTDAEASPLVNILVTATPQLAGDSIYAYTGGHGAYSLTVGPGSYRIGFSDPAGLHRAGYYSTGGFTADAGSATSVMASTADIGGISVVMPVAPGATYTAITPTRILDSRDGTGMPGGTPAALHSHVALSFQVTGGGSGVPASATAVTGNLTVTQQTTMGFLYIGPVATNNPTSSTLNFPYGDDRANAVTVALGVGGTLSVTYAAPSLGPTAHVIFDVTGYFTPDTSGATYHAITPKRLLDSRDGTGGTIIFSSHVAQHFQVTGGSSGVPGNATAVTGNLTVTQQSAIGFLYIGPNQANNPTSSTLNFPKGDDRANAVTVALGAGGVLWVTYAAPSFGPTAHVIFDVTGYFTPDMSGATYVPLTPTRILDTRDGTGGKPAFGSHTAGWFQVTGGGSGVPFNATAVTGNLTVTQQGSLGFLYIGPNQADNPTSSTLNFPYGDDRANAVTVALGSGGCLWVTFAAPTYGPTAHVIFDVTGYFLPATS